jgi:hypothetical protein
MPELRVIDKAADPRLSGVLGAAWVRGIQSQGVVVAETVLDVSVDRTRYRDRFGAHNTGDHND